MSEGLPDGFRLFYPDTAGSGIRGNVVDTLPPFAQVGPYPAVALFAAKFARRAMDGRRGRGGESRVLRALDDRLSDKDVTQDNETMVGQRDGVRG